MAEIANSLGELRRRRGLSAVKLAEAAGVSRQTIYAMEAGTYVPNTAVALRLARALQTTVEDLFTLAERVEERPRTERASILPGSEMPHEGQAVQLCRVDKKLMAAPPSDLQWCLPTADGVATDRSGHVRVFQAEGDFADRLLVAGCDPGISVLSRHVQAAGIELVLAHRNSSRALALLKEGCVHVAGTHLRDEATGESNLLQIRRMFPKNAVAVVSFAVWEEGILTARGNPKSIRGIEDFARADVSIVNREEGSGSRGLLDARLQALGMPGRAVHGYETLAAGHLAAAWQVRAGAADCCLATGAVARALALHFIPLVTERYDLVVRKQHLEQPRMQNLLDILSRSGFRRELEGLGGYDARVAGRRLL